MSTFRQIIFPPEPKTDLPSTGKQEGKLFEWWIVGVTANFVVYVKCPLCGFTYEMETYNFTLDELKSQIDRFPTHYFERVVRECPHVSQHKVYYERNL